MPNKDLFGDPKESKKTSGGFDISEPPEENL